MVYLCSHLSLHCSGLLGHVQLPVHQPCNYHHCRLFVNALFCCCHALGCTRPAYPNTVAQLTAPPVCLVLHFSFAGHLACLCTYRHQTTHGLPLSRTPGLTCGHRVQLVVRFGSPPLSTELRTATCGRSAPLPVFRWTPDHLAAGRSFAVPSSHTFLPRSSTWTLASPFFHANITISSPGHPIHRIRVRSVCTLRTHSPPAASLRFLRFTCYRAQRSTQDGYTTLRAYPGILFYAFSCVARDFVSRTHALVLVRAVARTRYHSPLPDFLHCAPFHHLS